MDLFREPFAVFLVYVSRKGEKKCGVKNHF